MSRPASIFIHSSRPSPTGVHGRPRPPEPDETVSTYLALDLWLAVLAVVCAHLLGAGASPAPDPATKESEPLVGADTPGGLAGGLADARV